MRLRKSLTCRNGFGMLYMTALIVTSALFGVLYYVAVPIADDLWFSLPADGTETFSQRFGDALELTRDLWQTDMIRLPNQFVALLLMVSPRWCVAILVSLLCMGAIEGGRRVIGASVSGWTTYTWLFCFWICLPWYDYMLSLSYIANYVLPSALTLWSLYCFLRFKEEDLSGKRYFGIMVLAFFAGWAHEGFAVPLAAGMGIAIIEYIRTRRRLPMKHTGILAMTCLGIIVICCSPILGERASEGGHKVAGMPLWEMLIQLGPSVMALFAATIAAIIGLVRHKDLRRKLGMLLTMCLTAELIAFIFYNGPRTTFAAVLYSMVMFFAVLRTVTMRRTATVVAAVMAIVLVSVNLGMAVKAQTRLSREFNEVTERYLESPTGEVYYDVTSPGVDATLLKTTVRVLNERIPLEFIEAYHSRHYADSTLRKLSILPSRLAGFPGMPEDSVSGKQRLCVYRNLVVADTLFESALTRRDPLMLTDSAGNETESRYRFSSFHGADGCRYLVVFPHAQTLNPSLVIREARIVEEAAD